MEQFEMMRISLLPKVESKFFSVLLIGLLGMAPVGAEEGLHSESLAGDRGRSHGKADCESELQYVFFHDLIRAGEDEKALRIIGELIDEHPEVMRFRIARASLYNRLGLFAEAADDFRVVLQEEGPSPKNFMTLAVALERSGNPGEAETYIDQLLKMYPDDVKAKAFKLRLMLARGEVEEVIREAKGLVDRILARQDSASNKDLQIFASYLGRALLLARRYQEALDLVLRISGKQGSWGVTIQAHALMGLKELGRAENLLRGVSAHHQASDGIKKYETLLVYVLARQGKTSEAASAYKALGLDNNSILARSMQLELFLRVGKFEFANSLLQGWPKDIPETNEVRWYRSEIAYRRGDLKAAADAMYEIIKSSYDPFALMVFLKLCDEAPRILGDRLQTTKTLIGERDFNQWRDTALLWTLDTSGSSLYVHGPHPVFEMGSR